MLIESKENIFLGGIKWQLNNGLSKFDAGIFR